MRLLFESGFSPTHAFMAFYRYLRDEFGAHALLHFGTHGALEFMPGKQTDLPKIAGRTASFATFRTSTSTPRTTRPKARSPSGGGSHDRQLFDATGHPSRTLSRAAGP